MTIIDSTKINVIKEYLKDDKYLCKSYMIIIKMADHYNIDAYKLTAIVKLKCKYLFTKRNKLYSFIGNIFASIWRKVSKFTIDDKYNKSVLMIHQVIAEIKYGEYESSNSIPDHLSRDTDDNRKCNIILKSNQRNSHNRGLSKVNTSGKTGVSYNKEKNMWTAYITVNYKTKYLGDYTDFNDAVNARKEAEKKYGFTCDDIVADYDKEVI